MPALSSYEGTKHQRPRDSGISKHRLPKSNRLLLEAAQIKRQFLSDGTTISQRSANFGQLGKCCTGELITRPSSNQELFLLCSVPTPSPSDSCHICLPLASKVPSNSRQNRLSMAQQIAGHCSSHGPKSQLLVCSSPVSIAFLLQRGGQSPWAGKSVGQHRDFSHLQPSQTQLIFPGLLKPATMFAASLTTDLKYPLMFPTLYCVFKSPVILLHKIHPSVTARFGFACTSANQM